MSARALAYGANNAACHSAAASGSSSDVSLCSSCINLRAHTQQQQTIASKLCARDDVGITVFYFVLFVLCCWLLARANIK